MARKIRKDTAARAASLGLTFRSHGDGFDLVDASGHVIADDISAAGALRKAQKVLADGHAEAFRATAGATSAAEQVVTARAAQPEREEAEDEDTDGAADEADAGEEEKDNRKTIVPRKYKDRYKAHGATCGDALARAFDEATTTYDAVTRKKVLDYDALISVGFQNGIDVADKWGGLNRGQQRMNLGNVLRGRHRRGERVEIADWQNGN